jgi:hypothetical protein
MKMTDVLLLDAHTLMSVQNNNVGQGNEPY